MDDSASHQERIALMNANDSADRESSPSIDHDAEDMMQQMMGFGNFNSTQRPPRPYAKKTSGRGGQGFGTGANSSPLVARQPNRSAPLQPSALPFIPASLPPGPRPYKPVQDSHHGGGIEVREQYQALEAFPRLAENEVKVPSDMLSQDPAMTESITATAPLHIGTEGALSSTRIINNPRSGVDRTANQHQSDRNPRSLASGLRQSHPNDNEVAYTNSTTNMSFTHAELKAYSDGIRRTITNSHGQEEQVTAYFRPSFVSSEEDLWGNLEQKAGLKAST